MKYLIKNRCINADQIVMAEYTPEHPDPWLDVKHPARCNITLAGAVTAGEFDQFATSERISLMGDEADRFWLNYIRDADCVVSP